MKRDDRDPGASSGSDPVEATGESKDFSSRDDRRVMGIDDPTPRIPSGSL
jgi:hypothetical protein